MEYRQFETPADAFSAIDEVLWMLERPVVRTEVERHPYGDTLRVNVEGIDPEGEQVDVDRFRSTWFDTTYVIDFADELPDEVAA